MSDYVSEFCTCGFANGLGDRCYCERKPSSVPAPAQERLACDGIAHLSKDPCPVCGRNVDNWTWGYSSYASLSEELKRVKEDSKCVVRQLIDSRDAHKERAESAESERDALSKELALVKDIVLSYQHQLAKEVMKRDALREALKLSMEALAEAKVDYESGEPRLDEHEEYAFIKVKAALSALSQAEGRNG